MTWNSSQPMGNTKLRNSPTLITNNFNAIEKGNLSLTHWQVNFIDRDTVPGAPPPTTNPTRQDNTLILFSKTASSESELFLMDDQNPANIIQLTEAGRLGGQTTNFSMNNFSFDGGTTDFNENNVISAYGSFNTDGVGTVFGCTVNATAPGSLYDITFSPARSNANYIVTFGQSSIANLVYQNKTNTTFRILSNANNIDFMVCGGV